MDGIKFFADVTSGQLIGWVFTILFALFPGFDLFQKIKTGLGLSGQLANTMVVAVSMLITAGFMYLTGELDVAGLEFTLGNIVEFGLVLYTASQVVYKRFVNKQIIEPE